MSNEPGSGAPDATARAETREHDLAAADRRGAALKGLGAVPVADAGQAAKNARAHATNEAVRLLGDGPAAEADPLGLDQRRGT